MYSDTNSLKMDPGLIQAAPMAGLVLALAGVALLVFFAGQQAMRLAGRNVAPGLSRGISREMHNSEGDGVPAAPYALSPDYLSQAAQRQIAPPQVALSPANAINLLAPFADPTAQAMAKESLAPLRQLLTDVHKQENDLFTAAATSRLLTPQLNDVASENGNPAAAVDRAGLITDALESETALNTHPDLFPQPLQDGAGEIGREIRAFLADAHLAAVSSSSTLPADLQAQGSAHLSRADTILSGLEAIASGGTDDGSSGIPVIPVN